MPPKRPYDPELDTQALRSPARIAAASSVPEYLVTVVGGVGAAFTHLSPRLPGCFGQFADSSTGLVSKC